MFQAGNVKEVMRSKVLADLIKKMKGMVSSEDTENEEGTEETGGPRSLLEIAADVKRDNKLNPKSDEEKRAGRERANLDEAEGFTQRFKDSLERDGASSSKEMTSPRAKSYLDEFDRVSRDVEDADLDDDLEKEKRDFMSRSLSSPSRGNTKSVVMSLTLDPKKKKR